MRFEAYTCEVGAMRGDRASTHVNSRASLTHPVLVRHPQARIQAAVGSRNPLRHLEQLPREDLELAHALDLLEARVSVRDVDTLLPAGDVV